MTLESQLLDPFSYYGLQKDIENNSKFVYRTFIPGAVKVSLKVSNAWVELPKSNKNGLFELVGEKSDLDLSGPNLLKIQYAQQTVETHDVYSFLPTITDFELYLFAEGNLKQAYNTFGAHMIKHQGIDGVRFALWAPNAEGVSIIGDFNAWDANTHPMRKREDSGVWELFIPAIKAGGLYKFTIFNCNTGQALIKTDPYGREFELGSGRAARITAPINFSWQDQAWLHRRAQYDWKHAPFNCYEVHLGSWKRNAQGGFLTYRELADELIPYVVEMGYTHIELLPITEHPLNESWGYQATGYFAASNRFGQADDLRFLIDACHQANIGVILDWVPGHFPKDDWALARFDGSPLYEHPDPRLGEQQDWGTYIFNYGLNEVRNFLIASAYFWLHEFHIDGLRVDAVASMLYLDYSRKQGEWLPNKHGGRENLEAIDFIKQLNKTVQQDFPGALTIAEESTAWPGVTHPTEIGGLGFSMKWNMGWMNDTLDYMQNEPIHRHHLHNKLTFAQLYSHTENFVLPFSHDEVVHGKKSLLEKMPGDPWQQFANLRLLLAFQMTQPGKKLNFMGNEFAHGREWNVNESLDWHVLTYDLQQGVKCMVRDLNTIYLQNRALHELDFESQGFEWIDCQNNKNSIISYIRRARNGSLVIVLLNFTPKVHHSYQIAVPMLGAYREIFNSDATCYGGSNQINCAQITADTSSTTIAITIPPLGAVILTSDNFKLTT